MASTPTKRRCDDAHKRVQAAAAALTETQQEVEQNAREARHGARNIQMLMHALLERMSRKNDD